MNRERGTGARAHAGEREKRRGENGKEKTCSSKRQRPLDRRGVLGVRRLEQVCPPGARQARPQVAPHARGARVEGQGAGVVARRGEVVAEVGRGDPVFVFCVFFFFFLEEVFFFSIFGFFSSSFEKKDKKKTIFLTPCWSTRGRSWASRPGPCGRRPRPRGPSRRWPGSRRACSCFFIIIF